MTVLYVIYIQYVNYQFYYGKFNQRMLNDKKIKLKELNKLIVVFCFINDFVLFLSAVVTVFQGFVDLFDYFSNQKIKDSSFQKTIISLLEKIVQNTNDI